MNVIEDSGFSNGKLEDSFIKRVSNARADVDAFDDNKHEDEDSPNKYQVRERKNSDDLSNIEDIANQISMYT